MISKQTIIVAAVSWVLIILSNYAWYHRITNTDSGVIKQQQQELRQQQRLIIALKGDVAEEISKKEKMRKVAKKAIEEANKLIEINRELLAELKKLKANNNNKVYI